MNEILRLGIVALVALSMLAWEWKHTFASGPLDNTPHGNIIQR